MWAFSAKGPIGELRAELQKARTETGKDIDLLAADQIDEAIDTAVELVGSGIVGDPDYSYLVSVSGNVNPGHRPRSGHVGDYVTISVWQLMPKDVSLVPVVEGRAEMVESYPGSPEQ